MAKNLRLAFLGSSSNLATSTTVKPSTDTATKIIIKDKGDTLYRRLSALGDPDIDVTETLNEWVRGGKKLLKRETLGIVNEFRRYKRFKHGLQILEWLDKNRNMKFSCADHALRLDLLSKVEGIEAAEKYCANFPDDKKNRPIYGALLHCYVKETMKEKALAVFDKMKELDVASSVLTYNNLMSLHLRVGEPEKIPALLQEMKEKDIIPDSHTYNFLMNSYALLNDMEKVECVLDEIKAAGVKCDWITYTNLACIYIKAGFFDKANSALETLENVDDLRDRRAYNMLISLYAQTSNKTGVKRVWKSLRSKFSDITNMSYLAMLHALSKLGDIDELHDCFEEWKSSFRTFDIRLVNVLVESYLERDMVKEANLLLEDAKARGAKPNSKTFEAFMNFYLKACQMDLALKNLEGACSEAAENKWHPSQETVSKFLKYFEEEKDPDGFERLYKSLKIINSLDSELYSLLLRAYVSGGLTEPDMRQRIEEDGIKTNSEIEKLLKTVCPK